MQPDRDGRGDGKNCSNAGAGDERAPSLRLGTRGRRSAVAARAQLVARLAQIAGEIARRRVSVPRLLREAALDDLQQARGNVVANPGERRRVIADDGVHRLHRGGSIEGTLARDELVKNDAEGELVAAKIAHVGARLLGRHVVDRAEDRAGRAVRHRHIRVADGVGQFGQPEVEDLHEAVGSDHHVLRLQIAMNDAAVVRRRQSLRHFGHQPHNLLERKVAFRRQVAQIASFDQLHDDEGDLVDAADVVDGDDVRMVELRRGARLLLEAAKTLDAGRRILRQDFQRDVAIEFRVARLEDLTHPPRTKPRDDYVRPEAEPRLECHTGVLKDSSEAFRTIYTPICGTNAIN